MKKELLSLLFVLILAAASQAAPSQFTTTGYMGIKTDDPQHALDIEGAAKSYAVEYPDGTFQIGAGSRDNLGYQITTLKMTSDQYGTTATIPMGMRFKPDGTRIFTLAWTDDRIYQHSCTTPWLLSSCSYDSVFEPTQDDEVRAIFVSPKGHRVYEVSQDGDSIYQYDCTTDWTLSSCSYGSTFLNVSAQEGTPSGLYFKPDGKKFFIVGRTTDRFREYTCTDAWEVDTCSATGEVLYIGAEEVNPEDILVINGGKNILMTGQNDDGIHQYSCSIPWDLSSCSYDNYRIDADDNTPGALEISSDGKYLYEVGWNNDTIIKYEFGLYTTGELGIGTENPQAAVDVNGAIEQSNAYFHAYDAAGTIAVDNKGWKNITWDTEVREDAMYTHAADSEEITINENGWYLIRYECTVDVTSGDLRYTADHRLLADGSELAGTRAASYHRMDTDGRDSARITRLYEVTGGSATITAQIISDADSGMETVADGCSITIERI